MLLHTIPYFFAIFVSIFGFLSPDELCELESGTVGVCKHIHNCPFAMEDLKKKKRPKTCSFEGFVPIVCCTKIDTATPEEEPPNYGKVSSEKCVNYAGLVFQNHSSPTLMHDELFDIEDTCAIEKDNYRESFVRAREFPHLASVGYDSPSGQVWKCSGALISEKYVLTAATCSNLPKLGLAKYVRLGSTSIREPFYHEEPLQYFDIQRFIKHPRFRQSTLVNNLALVELKQSVKFTSLVRPACLGVDQNRPLEAINVGWKTLNNDAYLNNEPLKNLMKVVDPRRCTGIMTNQICVQEVPGSLWQNCLVDQGSVLQVYNNDNYCSYDIIGVIVDWKDCSSGRPGIYTNVTAYVPWIEKTIWE